MAMKNEVVFVLEPDSGRATVEFSRASPKIFQELRRELGEPVTVNCARPARFGSSTEPLPIEFGQEGSARPGRIAFIDLFRLYHNSTVDGPGRRSVVQVAGCSIRCPGCYVPETHEAANGKTTAVAVIVAEILANRADHDGVTILGGEPFDQPAAIAELVARLKDLDLHVVVYTGYTLETLLEKKDKRIEKVLKMIDLLIDGPFIRELGNRAGEYRGSTNQRSIPQKVVT